MQEAAHWSALRRRSRGESHPSLVAAALLCWPSNYERSEHRAEFGQKRASPEMCSSRSTFEFTRVWQTAKPADAHRGQRRVGRHCARARRAMSSARPEERNPMASHEPKTSLRATPEAVRANHGDAKDSAMAAATNSEREVCGTSPMATSVPSHNQMTTTARSESGRELPSPMMGQPTTSAAASVTAPATIAP